MWMCERTDADMLMCGCVDVRMCRCVDVWMCVDMWRVGGCEGGAYGRTCVNAAGVHGGTVCREDGGHGGKHLPAPERVRPCFRLLALLVLKLLRRHLNTNCTRRRQNGGPHQNERGLPTT